MQCDVKNVADSLKLPDKQFPKNYGLHCLFSSSAQPCVISIPCCFAVTCLYTRSLVSSLEENKVIRGKRQKGKRRRVHKEDLLLLDNLIQTFSFCVGSILHLLSHFCEHMRSARDPYSRVVFFPTYTPVPNMYPRVSLSPYDALCSYKILQVSIRCNLNMSDRRSRAFSCGSTWVHGLVCW